MSKMITLHLQFHSILLRTMDPQQNFKSPTYLSHQKHLQQGLQVRWLDEIKSLTTMNKLHLQRNPHCDHCKQLIVPL
ncbi:unnamed protein product, partial [Linum tenue]